MKAYALFFLSIFALQVCQLFLFLIHPLFRPLPESDTPVFRSPSPRDLLRPLGSHTFKDPDPTFPLKATFDISPLNTDDSYVRRPFASRSPCPSIAGASETVLRLQETTRMHSPFGSISPSYVFNVCSPVRTRPVPPIGGTETSCQNEEGMPSLRIPMA